MKHVKVLMGGGKVRYIDFGEVIHKQGFPYWEVVGDGGSPPHQPKMCSFPTPLLPSPGKIPPVDLPPPNFYSLHQSLIPPLNNLHVINQ